jgi:hypothetical protein
VGTQETHRLATLEEVIKANSLTIRLTISLTIN